MKSIHKLGLLALFMPLFVSNAVAQSANSFRINEVVILNDSNGIQDEYGNYSAWIEIANTSWATATLRNCFLTNNKAVLDEKLSAPERMELMSILRPGDTEMEISPKGCLLFYADGTPNHGVCHLNFTLSPGKENFIALYDGNGVDLIDSITVPANLGVGQSYARITDKDGKFVRWSIMQKGDVTPGNANEGISASENKVREWKEKDPYGLTMTVLSMGIVFACLLLLYLFFRAFGIYAKRWNKQDGTVIKADATRMEMNQNEIKEDIQMEEIMAAIAMALHESQNAHDVESDKITIVAHPTDWNRKAFF